MISISFNTEIQNFNPIDRTCVIILYGLSIQNGKEIGRFFIDKKVLRETDFDLYVNQAEQSIDAKFLKDWVDSFVISMNSIIKEFEKVSNDQTSKIK